MKTTQTTKYPSISTSLATSHATSHVTHKNSEFLSKCFLDIKRLIDQKELSPFKLQEEIESYLFHSRNPYSNPQTGLTFNLNTTTSIWIFEKKDLIKTYLDNSLSTHKTTTYTGLSDMSLSQKQLKQSNDIWCVLTSDRVADMLISFFFDLAGKEFNEGRLIQTELFGLLGNKLINLYIFVLYSKSLKGVKKADQQTLSTWKNSNVDLINKLYDPTTIISVGGNTAQLLTAPSTNMIELVTEYGDDRKYHNTIVVQQKARALILKENQTIYTLPPRLPMVVKPKPYKLDGKIILGGYLKNDVYYTSDMFIDKAGYKNTTVLNEENDIINLVNGMNSVPYKINNDTLDFINMHGVEKGIILSDKDENVKAFRDNPYKKSTKRSNREIRSLMSQIYLQSNILSIAELYRSSENIYFPIRFDQRTRFYCSPDYFNYQSTDLAKSLILYVNYGYLYKDNINAINYFKSYGATLFNNDLGKKSLNTRIKWVDGNKDYILNFETNDIINKAEIKACFLSFCFEYRRFISFMNDPDVSTFHTYLPIQLDATCNGYQHISLLTRQDKLLKYLNLKPSTPNDKPEDFYSYVLYEVCDYIKNKLEGETFDCIEEKESMIKLQKVELSRNMVKKAVMTYSYNASFPRMSSYVREALYPQQKIILGKEETVYSVSQNSLDYLTNKDINTFVKCFITVIKETFPKMQELKNYLKSIVKICTKLNMPVPWVLPSGAIVSQSYLESKTLKVKLFAFMKSKYSFKYTIEDKFDLRKQSNAAMPNLIHSLDACSVALLYKELSAANACNIYTIHDCFAVTAGEVELLINLLKSVYIKIYSKNVYLVALDAHIKNTLISNFGSDIFTQDGRYVVINYKDKIIYPTLESVVDTKVSLDGLKHSSNIIV